MVVSVGVEFQFRYIVIEWRKNQPKKYYASKIWNDALVCCCDYTQMWSENIRDACFWHSVEAACFLAENLKKRAGRTVHYAVVSIRADAMPYKKWM